MAIQTELRRLRMHLEGLRAGDPRRTFADPVTFWEAALGHVPDPWQVQVLTSPSPRLLLNCSRQSGKSTTAAVLAVYEALRYPQSLILLVSASLRQSMELGFKFFSIYRTLGRPVPATTENKMSLALANGSRIICLPSKETTVRGFASARWVILDEAARIADEVMIAIRPTVAINGGKILAMSTPFGMRGWFHKAWTDEADWVKIKVTADDCPRLSPAFLASERAAMGEAMYRQEYLCSFESAADHVFDYDDVMNALDPSVKPLIPVTQWRAEDAWGSSSGFLA